MIIWRGRGFLVGIIAFGCLLIIELLAYFHDNTYYQKHAWPMIAGLLVAASFIWLLRRRYSQAFTEGGIQNHETRKSVLREQDELFFISVRYWPLILCVLGVFCFFVQD
jgi:hypothetical protein